MDTTEKCLRCPEIDNCCKVEEYMRKVPLYDFPVIKFFLGNYYWSFIRDKMLAYADGRLPLRY